MLRTHSYVEVTCRTSIKINCVSIIKDLPEERSWSNMSKVKNSGLITFTSFLPTPHNHMKFDAKEDGKKGLLPASLS